MNHSPALPPDAAAAHDKGYLRRLLSERNQMPASGTGVIDAAIEQAVVRSEAILVIDMGVMLYLCWRLFRGRREKNIDLGFLRYDDVDSHR